VRRQSGTTCNSARSVASPISWANACSDSHRQHTAGLSEQSPGLQCQPLRCQQPGGMHSIPQQWQVSPITPRPTAALTHLEVQLIPCQTTLRHGVRILCGQVEVTGAAHDVMVDAWQIAARSTIDCRYVRPQSRAIVCKSSTSVFAKASLAGSPLNAMLLVPRLTMGDECHIARSSSGVQNPDDVQ